MRSRTRIVSLIAAAATAGSLTACSAATAGGHASPAARLATTATPRPSATPATPSPSISPRIQVAGAPKKVKAKGAVLADAATGQVLWSRDLNAERPMASVTKVMTALLVLQAGNLGQEIRITKAAMSYAWKNGGESAG